MVASQARHCDERRRVVARFRGDRLAAAREAAGQTQADLALAVGVSAAQRIANWERGDEQPRPQFIPPLARSVEIAAVELLDVDPAKPGLLGLRLAAGLTVAEVAERTGLPRMTYNRLERGMSVKALTGDRVDALAKTLGVSAESLPSLLPDRG